MYNVYLYISFKHCVYVSLANWFIISFINLDSFVMAVLFLLLLQRRSLNLIIFGLV